jgi:hypothetical protein
MRKSITGPIQPRRKSIIDDTVFVMSKKIAQLTKVIFYLNTKTDDQSTLLNVAQLEYESELAEVTAVKIRLLNEEMEKLPTWF